MNKKVRLIDYVTVEGSEIKDQEVEIPERSAAALVAEGRAVYVDEEAATPAGDNVDPDAEATAALALVKKALNDKYKKDDLAVAAKGVGVEFAYDATKDVIVDAVVTAGKAEALLA